MNTSRKRQLLPYIPGYSNNTVLQLIFATGVAYIMLAITWAIMMIIYSDAATFNQYLLPHFGMPRASEWPSRWWTALTYGWFHAPNSFMEMASNMLWLYCFGSVAQMLVGHRQMIPLYIYSLLAGAAGYLLVGLLPGAAGVTPGMVIGPRAGLVGMAAAAITLSPSYRFYISDTFSIPMAVVAGVFGALMILSTGLYLPLIAMMVAGGLMGFLYVKLLKKGYRPGAWMYDLCNKVQGLATPNEAKIRARRGSTSGSGPSYRSITSERIDEILDKINQKGYKALSTEEREILMRAGRE